VGNNLATYSGGYRQVDGAALRITGRYENTLRLSRLFWQSTRSRPGSGNLREYGYSNPETSYPIPINTRGQSGLYPLDRGRLVSRIRRRKPSRCHYTNPRLYQCQRHVSGKLRYTCFQSGL